MEKTFSCGWMLLLKTRKLVVNMLIMGLTLKQSLMVVSTTGILLLCKVHISSL